MPYQFEEYKAESVVPFDEKWGVPYAFRPNKWPLWKYTKAQILSCYTTNPIYVTDPVPYAVVSTDPDEAEPDESQAKSKSKSKSAKRPPKKKAKLATKTTKKENITGPKVAIAAKAPPCIQLGEVVENKALEAKFTKLNWAPKFVPLACACVQIILLIIANYALPDGFMNHPDCSQGEVQNSQRTLAKNLIARVCHCYAAGYFGAKSPGRWASLELWSNQDGNERGKDRLNQILGWVVQHFGGATEDIRQALLNEQQHKNSRGKATGAVNPKHPQRVHSHDDFKMTITEKDIYKVNLTNARGTLISKLQQRGVNSIEKLHNMIEKKEEVPSGFFKAVPLPMALIFNALTPECDPGMWKYHHVLKWQATMSNLNKKWKTTPVADAVAISPDIATAAAAVNEEEKEQEVTTMVTTMPDWTDSDDEAEKDT